MPQLYAKRGHISIHPDVLLARPRIGALVAETFNAFSRADAHLANVFAAVLDANEDVALDLFLAINSEGPRNAVLDSLLRGRLAETEYHQLSALRKRRGSLISWRNSFAHDVWALASDSGPDEILIIKQKDYIRWHRAHRFLSADASADEIRKRNSVDALVYTEKEIGEHHDEVHDLSRDISALAFGIMKQRP